VFVLRPNAKSPPVHSPAGFFSGSFSLWLSAQATQIRRHARHAMMVMMTMVDRNLHLEKT